MHSEETLPITINFHGTRTIKSYNDEEQRSEDCSGEIHVYSRRWFVVLVVAAMNLANAMLWISYGPITDLTSVYYEVSYMNINWLALIFPLVCLPLGLVSSWLLDTLGLRVAMLLCGSLDLLGALLRIGSALPLSIMPSQTVRFPLAFLGQSCAAAAQPFVLFASTKTAAVWFPVNQRAMANTIASMANPFGILIANLLSPFLVHSANDMLLMQVVFAGPALCAFALAFGMFCTGSTPPQPPSRSRATQVDVVRTNATFCAGVSTFLKDVRAALRVRAFWVLMATFGCGMGLFTSLSTLLGQVLCPYGYSDSFSGLCGALLIAFGIVGAALSGALADKYGCFTELVRVAFTLSSLGAIGFAVASSFRKAEIYIACTIAWFGFFGFATYPVVLELGVESTFPVGEAASSGLLIIAGQFFSVLFIFVMQILASYMPPEKAQFSTCALSNNTYAGAQTLPQDYLVPNFCAAGFAVAGSILCIFALRTTYKRKLAEKATENNYAVIG